MEGQKMRADTKKAVTDYKAGTFMFKKEIASLETQLSSNEEVLYIATTNVTITNLVTGTVEKLPGAFMLTTERILFSYKVLLDHSMYTCDLADVKMVNCRGNGLTGGQIEITTTMQAFNIRVLHKKSTIHALQHLFDETIKNRKQQSQNAPVVANSPSGADEILKYKHLMDAGVISAEEFEAKKKQLLGLD